MSYVDIDYYLKDYEGIELTLDAFSRLEKRATEIIDILTNFEIQRRGIDSYHALIQKQIKMAVASQIEYLVINGESNALGAGGYGQIKVGNFSYGDRAGKESLKRSETMTSQKVLALLSSAGLLYQGVDVYG